MARLCSLVERRKLWPLPPWAPRFDIAKEYTVFGIDICVWTYHTYLSLIVLFVCVYVCHVIVHGGAV